MGNKVHVFIILGFLLSGVLQSDIISVLQINSDLIIKPASGNFRILPFVSISFGYFLIWGMVL